MSNNELDLNTIKLHLRISHDLEDPLIETYVDWATSSVIESVTTEDDADMDYLGSNKEYQKAVILLTSFYYENRLTISDKKQVEMPYGVLDAIQKLRGNPNVVKEVESNEI